MGKIRLDDYPTGEELAELLRLMIEKENSMKGTLEEWMDKQENIARSQGI